VNPIVSQIPQNKLRTTSVSTTCLIRIGQFLNLILFFSSFLELIASLENYNITKISCGFQHSMAINEWGQLFAWGSNSSGQCGHENDSSAIYPMPKLVKSLATKQIVQVACGQFHSLALTNSGELYSFGANLLGQLGLGFDNEKVVKPTLVKSLAGVPISFLSCGGNHSFVISKSGAVFGWGKNLYGQLGVNDQVSKNFPTQLRTLRSIGVRYIACGDDFSVFLTHEGGVFTCGAGTFGQLGHGHYSNEILPRMVLELMGSTVTQIVCGRRHTLTYVPSRKRVYGFGLGGNGQLGSGKDCTKSSVPQSVHGPWVSSTSVDDTELKVKSIFAGGDHCLVSLVHISSDSESEDFRDNVSYNQIWSLSKELAESCANTRKDQSVDMELITTVEVVFKNLACFNASFLLDNNGHHCSSKHHGINLKYAEETFECVRKIENENLKTLIWESITNDLLSSLSTSPPDVETLRIFLILPLYHEFVNSKNYIKLHTPFCKVMLNLDKIPLKIISGWYSMTTPEYFERLIAVFKNVLLYFFHFKLSEIQLQSTKQVMYQDNFYIVLNYICLLYHINHQQRQEKVPYEVFHIPEITEYFEIRQDYISWCADMNQSSFYLCNYPFLFDAPAKHLLLQTDQALQMHNAMHAAATNSIFTQFFGAPANIYIMLNVTRENIVEDTIRELTQYTSADLMKPLKVKFAGEEAEDAGGVRKEFFMLLLKDVLDAKYGMFKYYEDTRVIWFAEDSFESEEMYKLVGILCGLAIYNFTIINISFPLALYKKLLNEKPELSDLKELSPLLAQSMQSILDYEGADLTEVFDLSFEISRTYFGENRVFELKPNGSNISVTQENK
jgi:E3 ubiquitin-protein ligase HERC4